MLGPVTQHASIRILVLEDQEEMCTTLCEVLRKEGYQVEEAASGEEAILKFHIDSFDLVVADIRMEGLDGLDVLQKVKAERPEVASLVITGYSSEADTVGAVDIGVQAYLRKPFDLSVFLSKVAQLAAQRRLEIERRSHNTARLGTTLWAAVDSYREPYLEGCYME